MSVSPSPAPHPHVVLVSQQPSWAQAVQATLRQHGQATLHLAPSAEAAHALLTLWPVERVWVDAALPCAEAVVQAARAWPPAPRPLSVVVLAGTEPMDHLAWVVAGADECLDGSVGSNAFEARWLAWLREREDRLHRFERLALSDPQTGLPNHTAGAAALVKAQAAALRAGYPLALLLWAVPFTGLVDAATHIQHGARAEDLLVRWADDRLLLVATRASVLDAARLADRLCRSLPVGVVGHAVGVVAVGGATDHPTALERAHAALQQALDAGGGAVALWADGGPRLLTPARRA